MVSADQILEGIEALPPMRQESERGYLGASEIGHPCPRYLWLKFHRYTKPDTFEPRMLRLFHRGQREEAWLQSYLQDSGFSIVQNCFDQERFTDGFFSGAGDGIVERDGVRYVVEYKTHSLKSFDTLERGRLGQLFPKHYEQLQINGHQFGCSHGIYLAVCKNDDRLFCDVIEIDPEKAGEILKKAEFITMADKPPPRIASKPTAFDCKFCSAKAVCWGFEAPRVDCRNCTSHEKHRDHGTFGCELDNTGKSCSVPCEKHSFNPYALNDLLGWEPLEFHKNERAVTYKKKDGTQIINGASPFGVPSLELEIE